MIHLIHLNVPIGDALNGVRKCRPLGARGFLLNFLQGHNR
jgi:hypothetical protein